MKNQCNCGQSDHRLYVSTDRNTKQTARTGAQRGSWRRALGLLTGAPFRIHHYRDIHTRMLHDALCDLECGEAGEQRR